jgi:hypothetical protein
MIAAAVTLITSSAAPSVHAPKQHDMRFGNNLSKVPESCSVCRLMALPCTCREQENNSKHLQMVSGAPPTAFWLSNFAWDLLNFSLPAAGILALVAWYNQPQLAGPRLAALAVLLGAFSGAGVTLTYLCHFMFKVSSFFPLLTFNCTTVIFCGSTGVHACIIKVDCMHTPSGSIFAGKAMHISCSLSVASVLCCHRMR